MIQMKIDRGENGGENVVVIHKVYKIQSIVQAVAPEPSLIKASRFT